ncbi:MAG: hypothetical protein U0270_42035 [Labilithrix sp.]
MRLHRASRAAVELAVLFLAGCNAIVGLRDVEEGSLSPDDGGALDASKDGASTTDGATTTDGAVRADGAASDGAVTSDSASDADVGDGDAGAGDAGAIDAGASDAGASVGGVLHFLQSGGSVTLSSGGANAITLTANGAFQLPVTGAYDVVVTTQPAGQSCWVTNGKGNASSPAAGLEVRCTVVRRSVDTATVDRSFSAASYQAMDDLDGITLQTDVPAAALVYVSVPSIDMIDPAFTAPKYAIAVFIDNQPVAEALTRVHFAAGANQTPVTAFATPTLTVGPHTIQARWQRVSGTEAPIRNAKTPWGTAIHAELGAIVLDSLPSFDRLARTSTKTAFTVPSVGVDTDIGIPTLGLDLPAKQPVLLMGSVPDLSLETDTSLLLDGSAVASQRYRDNDPSFTSVTSPTPMLLRSLAAGKHSVDARVRWLGLGGGATYAGGGDSRAAALTALLFKPAAVTAAWESELKDTRLPAPATAPSLTSISPVVSVTTTKASKALVMLDVTRAGASDESNGNEWPVEVAVFLGSAQGPTILAGRGNWGDYLRSNLGNRLAIVDLPPGTTNLDLRFRFGGGGPMAYLGARMGVIVLE